jgi:cytoskeletal protein RodZ
MEQNQTQPTSSKKNMLITVIIILILAGLVYWYVYLREPAVPEDPRLQELEQLKNESVADTSTIEERIADLEKLEKSSKPVGASSEDRLKELDELSG